MKAVGIIAEFNPLHKGHRFLLEKAKEKGTVVAVISGNFVQRGDVAVYDKRKRAEAALLCGADLVLELPVCYSMSTAQNFALGGVSALKAVGCGSLFFGSEEGDIAELLKTAEILRSEEFGKKISEYSSLGETFAVSREKAAISLGVKEGILSGANNNLAIEYINAAKSIGADFEFLTVKRQGVSHDSKKVQNGFASASYIRNLILSGEEIKEFILRSVQSIFDDDTADIRRLESAVLAVLRTKTIDDFKRLPDLSEGIENKLFEAIKTATSLDELYSLIKVKRYTLARVRRLVLSAFLGLDKEFFMKEPPYIRVLGFNEKGLELLREKNGGIPIVTKVSEIDALGEKAKRLFAAEQRATDLYGLAFENPKPKGMEYTAKIIKKD